MKDFTNEPNSLFGDAAMAEIARITAITDEAALATLQERLRAVGQEYRRIISMTPCDLPGAPSDETLSQRLAWVDTQLLNPLDKLLEALDPKNRHMLSLWPEEVSPELIPDCDAIAEQLKGLQVLGWNLAILIAKYRHHELPHGPLIRYRIVASIASTLDEVVPEIRPSRGTYDATTKRYYGIYPSLIRRIFLGSGPIKLLV